MRAALLPAVGARLSIVERPIPVPGPGEVLVRIDACGVCGSDLFLQAGGFGVDKLPVVPGHEAAGVVHRLGPDVTGLHEGQQVAIYYIRNSARARRANLGPDVERMGVDVDGAFAEYVLRPAETLIVPPEPVPPATLAVLTDAVATPHHALTQIARVQPGETVVVIGIGGIGSNAVQLGRILGARVLAVARSEDKRRLALEMGAERAGDLDEISAACRPDGPDVVLQCASSAELDRAAVTIAGFAGRVVFIATTADSFSVRASELVWRELSLLGSRGFTPQDIRDVIALYLAGKLRTDHLTGATRPLAEINEALDDLRAKRVLRSVILPWS